jgi:hypothetical protein
MKFLAILLSVVVAFYIVRKVRGLLAAAAVPPPRIHLLPVGATGMHALNLDRYARELESRGFARLGTYRVDRMRGVVLTAFSHVGESLCAVVYTHPLAGAFIDIVTKNEAGRTFTITTAPAGKDLDQPDGHEKVFDQDMPVERMIEVALQRRPAAPYVSWSVKNFAQQFEEAYAREMDWRAGRGGVTSDEVRRTAATMGGKFSEKNVQDATRRLHRQYMESRRDMS